MIGKGRVRFRNRGFLWWRGTGYLLVGSSDDINDKSDEQYEE